MKILIGHTGFVGKNLSEQTQFDAYYHRKNLHELRNQSVDQIVCAGLPATKWLANQNPEEDHNNMLSLIDTLKTVRCQQFILISTIDVYPDSTQGDENTLIEKNCHHAYGNHRFEFEQFIQTRFPQHHIVRLPGLFGHHLKKNVIFDLLHQHQLENIQPFSQFQWYDLNWLWQDIQITLKHNLSLVNFVTEPIQTKTIVEKTFPFLNIANHTSTPVSYNIKTIHADIFGGNHAYMRNKETVLNAIQSFVAQDDARKNL